MSLENVIKNAERNKTPETQFAVAKMLVGQKRYDEALPWLLLSSATAALPEAQYILGFFNEKGLGGLAKNEEEAFKMYRLAAQQGFTEAQFSVGMFLYKEKKYTEAFPWLELAATQGHANAQFMLGHFYEKGIVVKKDAKAFESYQKAALQGLVRAQLKMGQLYKMGELVQRNVGVAKKWFLLAAQQGDSQGQYEYGRTIFQEDQTKAVAWFQLAVAQNNADAQFALGKCFEAGDGGLAENIGEAMRYYDMAAKAGQKEAQYELGLSLLEGQNVAMNVGAGTNLIVLSAKQNYADAQEYLGEMYYHGLNEMPKDEAEGIKWYNLAAVNESDKAQYNMGLICWEKKQYLKGLKWFKLAAAANQQNDKASLALAKIYAEGLDGVGKDKEKALFYYKEAGVPDDDAKLTALTEGIARNNETLRRSLTTVNTKAFVVNWIKQIFKNPKDTIVEFVSQEEPFNTENPFDLVEMTGMHWAAVKKISQELHSNTLNSLLRAIKMSLEMFKQEKNSSFLLYASGLVGMYQNDVLQDCNLMEQISVMWKAPENSGLPFIVTPTQAVPMVQNFQWIFFDMVCRLMVCVRTASVTVPYDENSFTLFDMFYENDGFIVGNCVMQSMFEACVLQHKGVAIEKIYLCLQINPESAPRRTMQSLQRDNNVPSQGGPQGWRATHWLTNYNSSNHSNNAAAPPPAKKPPRIIKRREISGLVQCGRDRINFKDHANYIAQSVLYMNMWFFKKKIEKHKKISLKNSYRATKLNAILFLYLRTLLEGETTLVRDIVADYLQNEIRDDNDEFFELDKSDPDCLEVVLEARDILDYPDQFMEDIMHEMDPSLPN